MADALQMRERCLAFEVLIKKPKSSPFGGELARRKL